MIKKLIIATFTVSLLACSTGGNALVGTWKYMGSGDPNFAKIYDFKSNGTVEVTFIPASSILGVTSKGARSSITQPVVHDDTYKLLNAKQVIINNGQAEIFNYRIHGSKLTIGQNVMGAEISDVMKRT